MSLAIGATLQDRFDALDRFVFGTALVFAVGFVISRLWIPYPGDYLVKAVPAVFLGLVCLKHIRGSRGIYLCIGLFFSAGGDVFMELNRRPEYGGSLFLGGLSTFLVAHIFFILAFRRDFRYHRVWLPVIGLLCVYGVALFLLCLPRMGGLMLPVLFYTIVIMTMGILAVLRAVPHLTVFFGALSFILSDSLIGLSRFHLPEHADLGFAIMITYYAALFLISGGFLFDPAMWSELDAAE